MKIYISGPMAGVDDYMDKFSKAENDLRQIFPDADIINPAKILDPLSESTTWTQYMDIALNILRGCDRIYMLRGWEKSIGSKVERIYSEGSGINVYYE